MRMIWWWGWSKVINWVFHEKTIIVQAILIRLKKLSTALKTNFSNKLRGEAWKRNCGLWCDIMPIPAALPLTYKRNRFCPRAFCLFLSHHSFGLRYLLHHHLHHYCCCHLHHHYRLILGMKLFSRCSLYDQSLELGKSLGFEKWKNTKMGEKLKSNAHTESRMIAPV